MNYIYIESTVSVSVTTREWGAYTRAGLYTGGGAYIRVDKRANNLGGVFSGELIHGGGDLFTEFYGINDFLIV